MKNRAFLLIVGLMLFGACSESTQHLTNNCSTDSDCSAGYFCAGGFTCVMIECETTAECDEGHICVEHLCIPTELLCTEDETICANNLGGYLTCLKDPATGLTYWGESVLCPEKQECKEGETGASCGCKSDCATQGDKICTPEGHVATCQPKGECLVYTVTKECKNDLLDYCEKPNENLEADCYCHDECAGKNFCKDETTLAVCEMIAETECFQVTGEQPCPYQQISWCEAIQNQCQGRLFQVNSDQTLYCPPGCSIEYRSLRAVASVVSQPTSGYFAIFWATPSADQFNLSSGGGDESKAATTIDLSDVYQFNKLVGRFYDSNGAGSDVVVSEYTTAHTITFLRAFPLANNEFGLVWSDLNPESTVLNYARLNQLGEPLQEQKEIIMISYGEYTFDLRDMTAKNLTDGSGFVVSWISSGMSQEDGYTYNYLRSQVFDAEGTPISTKLTVAKRFTSAGIDNIFVENLSKNPFLKTIDQVVISTNIAIGWLYWDQEVPSPGAPGYNGIGFQIHCFNSNLEPVGNVFTIPSNTTQDVFNPSLFALNDGNFAVVWENHDRAQKRDNIFVNLAYYQLLNNDCSEKTEKVLLATNSTSSTNHFFHILAGEGNSFQIIWGQLSWAIISDANVLQEMSPLMIKASYNDDEVIPENPQNLIERFDSTLRIYSPQYVDVKPIGLGKTLFTYGYVPTGKVAPATFDYTLRAQFIDLP